MNIQEFEVGKEFSCGNKIWRCSDKGSRVIAAICLNDADSLVDPKNLSGPPYSIQEYVFDEYDMGGCTPLTFSLTGGRAFSPVRVEAPVGN